MSKIYNLDGQPVEQGLKEIGAIKEIDQKAHGRFEIRIMPEGEFPFRFRDAVLKIDSNRLHQTDYVRRNRKPKKDAVVEPMYEGPARCTRCGWQSSDRKRGNRLVDVPDYNGRGKMFECPKCSSTLLAPAKNYLHFELKSVKAHKPERATSSVLL